MTDTSNFNNPTAEPELSTTRLTGEEIKPEAVEAEAIAEAVDFQDDQGRRHVSFISTKHFIPGGNRDGLLRFLLDMPADHIEWLGSISGEARAVEEKTNKVKEGAGEKEVISIALIGDFEATIADADGVLGTIRSTVCYLPNTYARSVRNSLAADKSGDPRAELDIEIGIAKTGRMIPYEWAIRSYGSDETERRLLAIRLRQRARLERRQSKRLAGGAPTLRTIEGSVNAEAAQAVEEAAPGLAGHRMKPRRS